MLNIHYYESSKVTLTFFLPNILEKCLSCFATSVLKTSTLHLCCINDDSSCRNLSMSRTQLCVDFYGGNLFRLSCSRGLSDVAHQGRNVMWPESWPFPGVPTDGSTDPNCWERFVPREPFPTRGLLKHRFVSGPFGGNKNCSINVPE